MESFKKKFVEEALEYLDQLETALLKLESSPEDEGLIEQIFRIMHTLKGNSAMFGFSQIDKFTHQLETIYDLIRSGEMKVSMELVDLTLAAVDHIGNLLEQEDELSKQVQSTHDALLELIQNFIQRGETPGKDASVVHVQEEGVAGNKEGVRTFYVNILPDPDILLNGTNPLYLLDDFAVLGNCMVYPRFTQPGGLENMDSEKCYTTWELILSTREDFEVINEIFMFVSDSCKVEIHEVAQSDLLENQEFRQSLNHSFAQEQELGMTKLWPIIESFKDMQEEKTRGKDEMSKSNAAKNSIASIRVPSGKLDDLMNLVSELVTNQASLNLLSEHSNDPDIVATAESMEKITRQLRDNVFSMSVIPLDTIMIRFQRLVRDLSSELNKDVELHTEGTETELDKNIIESIADPIMHILRNSLDHGIESKDERARLGKPEKGRISLRAFYSGMNVFIQILDDGRGIDPEKIRQKAIAKGLVSADSVIDEKGAFDLVFRPGFSTASEVTDVSGRGVGMDVVNRRISDLRGSVEVSSKVNEGTTITIKLPLTLSIIDGLLVNINDTHYVVQLPVVDKVYEIPTRVLLGNFNRHVQLEGELIPFLHLRDEFEITGEGPETTNVIVVKYMEQRIGLTVDQIVGEHQAVLKPLGKLFSRQEMVSGAAILGDGTVALVLDTNLIIDTGNQLSREAS